MYHHSVAAMYHQPVRAMYHQLATAMYRYPAIDAGSTNQNLPT